VERFSQDRMRVALIVQDEETRYTGHDSLVSEGYEVFVVHNSVEALLFAAEFPDAIDLILTGPNSRVFHNGPQLIACMQTMLPGAKVLSGA